MGGDLHILPSKNWRNPLGKLAKWDVGGGYPQIIRILVNFSLIDHALGDTPMTRKAPATMPSPSPASAPNFESHKPRRPAAGFRPTSQMENRLTPIAGGVL